MAQVPLSLYVTNTYGLKFMAFVSGTFIGVTLIPGCGCGIKVDQPAGAGGKSMTTRRGMLPGLCIAVLCLCMASGGVAAERAERAAQPAWSVGDPIVTYWAGPGSHNVLDDTAAAQLVAGGWNLAWGDTPEHLATAHRHGLRVLYGIGPRDLDDPKWKKRVDELIDEAKDHPAMYAYYLQDEPTPDAFPLLARLKAYIAERDPNHPIWVNLYPTYASPGRDGQLGTEGDTVTAYREHVRLYMETVKAPLLSYDHYNFKEDGGDGNQYFLNLAMIRDAALRYDVPFVNVMQAVQWHGLRDTKEGEMRWLTYTTLAYGGQGLCHYVYNFKNVSSGFFDQKDEDRPLPRYWSCSRLNRDFVAIGTELQALTSLGAYHAGDIPMGADALPAGSPFVLDPPLPIRPYENPDLGLRYEEPIDGMLLGCFGQAGKPTHVLVVNLDYTNAVKTDLVGPGPMRVFHAPTRTWGAAGEGVRVKLELSPGGGALVSLVR